MEITHYYGLWEILRHKKIPETHILGLMEKDLLNIRLF